MKQQSLSTTQVWVRFSLLIYIFPFPPLSFPRLLTFSTSFFLLLILPFSHFPFLRHTALRSFMPLSLLPSRLTLFSPFRTSTYPPFLPPSSFSFPHPPLPPYDPPSIPPLPFILPSFPSSSPFPLSPHLPPFPLSFPVLTPPSSLSLPSNLLFAKRTPSIKSE